jgi:hypothetical protein
MTIVVQRIYNGRFSICVRNADGSLSKNAFRNCRPEAMKLAYKLALTYNPKLEIEVIL